jgi:hypothetical protein
MALIPADTINTSSRWVPGVSVPDRKLARELTELVTVTHGLQSARDVEAISSLVVNTSRVRLELLRCRSRGTVHWRATGPKLSLRSYQTGVYGLAPWQQHRATELMRADLAEALTATGVKRFERDKRADSSGTTALLYHVQLTGGSR